MMKFQRTALAVAIACGLAPLHASAGFTTPYEPMMMGVNGASTAALFTISDYVVGTGAYTGQAGRYVPVGILDGLGAYKLNDTTVRVLANHELGKNVGEAYSVGNGSGGSLSLKGARVSYFDIDKATQTVVGAGLAYNKIYDREGKVVTDASQVGGGFDRFCSSALFEPKSFGGGTRGFENRLYFTGEESDGGTQWVVDVATGNLWAASQLGRGAWENWTQVDTGRADKIAVIGGDDRQGAPLYLYVGTKNSDPNANFLQKNGLADGKLYVWKASDPNVKAPSDFGGQGSVSNGTWIEVENHRPGQAGTNGYDAQGYATQTTLDGLTGANSADPAKGVGAFSFSRPEDVATNPKDGTQVAFASTGRSQFDGGSDTWGTVYLVDLEFDANGNPAETTVKILYDGNEDTQRRVRSPDNLTWADDGLIYIQEDKSADWGNAAINPNRNEASVVRLDPATYAMQQVAETDRSKVAPFGATDSAPSDLGNWESSGIIDVSSLFGKDPGTLFLLDVQAHSVKDGLIGGSGVLVEGGQLLFLDASGLSALPPSAVPIPAPALLLGSSLAVLATVARRRTRAS